MGQCGGTDYGNLERSFGIKNKSTPCWPLAKTGKKKKDEFFKKNLSPLGRFVQFCLTIRREPQQVTIKVMTSKEDCKCNSSGRLSDRIFTWATPSRAKSDFYNYVYIFMWRKWRWAAHACTCLYGKAACVAMEGLGSPPYGHAIERTRVGPDCHVHIALSSCVTTGKSLNPSRSQLPPLQKGNDNTRSYLIGCDKD